MATLSQNRIAPLSLKMQQAAGSTIASMISQQVVDKYTTDFTLFEAKDRFPVDATGGAITVTVPLMTALPIGKPFIVEKIAGGNDVTIQLSGDDEFEGDDAVVLAEIGDAFAFISDGAVMRRAFPAPLAAAVPAGALAIENNLSDLDDAATALTNLGGTTTGKALFTAASAVAARTTLGTNDFVSGPIKLSLVAADADQARFRAPVAGVITIYSTQNKGTVATGAATTTLLVAGVAPTANTLTHAIGHAPGQSLTMTPSGPAASCAIGDEIRLTITGTNDGAGSSASYMVHIART